MPEILLEGWILFSEYCRKHNIAQNGNHIRLLEKMPKGTLTNVTPTSTRATHAVLESAANKIFLKEVN